MAIAESNNFLTGLSRHVRCYPYEGPHSVTDKLYDEWKAGRHAVVFTGVTDADLDDVDKGRLRLGREAPSFGQIDFNRRSKELIIAMPSPVQRNARDYIVGYILANLADMSLVHLVSNSNSMSYLTSQRVKEPCQSIWLRKDDNGTVIDFPRFIIETGFSRARPTTDITWWLNVSEGRVKMALSIVHDIIDPDSDTEEVIELTTWVKGSGIGFLRYPEPAHHVQIIRSGKNIQVYGPDVVIPLEILLEGPANPAHGERDIILNHEVMKDMATMLFDLPRGEPEIKIET